MARRFILSDDLTGEEVDGVLTHVFMVDNVFYEFDFAPASMTKFEKAMAPYIKVMRETRRITATAKGEASEAERIRQWAKANGMEVAERGRLSEDIVEAYKKAQDNGANSNTDSNKDDDSDSAQNTSSDDVKSDPEETK